MRFIDRSVNGAGTPDETRYIGGRGGIDKHAEAGIKQHQVIIGNASSPTPTPSPTTSSPTPTPTIVHLHLL